MKFQILILLIISIYFCFSSKCSLIAKFKNLEAHHKVGEDDFFSKCEKEDCLEAKIKKNEQIIFYFGKEAYEMESFIGGGGFGRIYLVKNVKSPQQHKVVKFLVQLQSTNLEEINQEELDIITNNKKDHETKRCDSVMHLDDISFFGPNKQFVAILTEHIDGSNGENFDYTQLDKKTLLNVMKGIINGIKCLHDTFSRYHYDFKLQNLMIDKKSYLPKIIDIEAAKTRAETLTIFNKQQIKSLAYSKGYEPFSDYDPLALGKTWEKNYGKDSEKYFEQFLKKFDDFQVGKALCSIIRKIQKETIKNKKR